MEMELRSHTVAAVRHTSNIWQKPRGFQSNGNGTLIPGPEGYAGCSLY